jgi:hypothetical protein
VFSRPGNLFPQVVIDLGDQVTVVLPDNTLEVFGHISHLEHSITPLSPSGVVWESTIGLETYPGFV